MDNRAFFTIGYGLYLLSSKDGDKKNGCIINTAMQLTSNPARILVSVNKNNYTNELMAKSGKFNLSVLTKDVPFDVIRHFGFSSGRDTDKITGNPMVGERDNGIPYLLSYANAVFECEVYETADAGTHTVFFADVREAVRLSEEESVTYSYYQTHIKPKPQEAKKTVWRCTVCGYEYEGEELPDDFICPICKHGKQDFVKVEKQENNTTESEKKAMKKWRCKICGEIVVSDTRPEKCPLCQAPGEEFEEVIETEQTWATEHVIGIAKDAPQEIIDGLRSNFQGECTEVGMYLAMSRAAAREGYPEIAEYWKTAAYEEAEHAAKFAELLGEVVSESTAKNLAVRVEAEHGATAGKFELAKKAKAANLDAIHDTVHEMAKDEARHGKAFKGLLERYFK